MFFVVSKIGFFFLQPLNIAVILSAACILALLLKRRRLALAAAAIVFLVIAVPAWTDTGLMMLRPLEARFPRPAVPPANVTGIIVLGGFFDGRVDRVRGGYELNEAGDRAVETAVLARRYPAARILVAGGPGSLFGWEETDAAASVRFFAALGIPRERLLLDDRSRNTYENALFARELAEPKPGETWLLVTSAFHMPRSVGLFRKVGFDVVPWPVDYRTTGKERFGRAKGGSTTSMDYTTLALHEWIGLVAYRLTGRIGSLFPGLH